MSFWKELSRRNVVKVGIAYAVAAWLIIHPVDIIFPILHLPEWSITLVTAFLIICFPFVLIFSWVYEVTPKGLKKTKDIPISKSTTHLTGRKLNYIIIGLLVLAVALLIFDNFYLDRRTVETKQAAVVTDVDKTKKTIAVLPFENLSSDPEQVYFVDGLSEELLNTLTQIPDLGVTARTSSFSFKGSNKTVQEIANVLGVENILEGSVRKAGDELRVTAQLVRAKDGFHIWSKTYDRELKDIFLIQEDIAKAIAGELKASLGIAKSLKQLGGTDNLEAYEQYLIAQGKMGDYDTYTTAIIPVDKAIEMDPKFALAWATKAWIHNFLAVSVPGNQIASESNAALNAAQKAIELEPNLAAGYYSLGFTKMSKGDWIQAGLSFYKAIDLQTELLWNKGIMQAAIHYMAVANFKKAYELQDKLRQNDPLSQDSRANYMANLCLLGDIRRAEEEYERCKELFGGHWIIGDSYIRLIRLGTTAMVSRDEINSQVPSWDPIGDKVSQYIGTPEKGLAELYQSYATNNSLSSKELVYISVWAAYFGNPEFAMDAMEKGVKLEGSGIFWIWLPVMKDVRQTPRFKTFVKKIGLVDYWNKFGWPDMCHQLDNGDFVCD